ncbi:MAG: hypothetical protein JF606_00145 [Burkholderiales bacterium]|nr:hypothetical protein [Burkholderiales bacterium]
MTDAAFLPLGKGDLLVVDASDESISEGRTSAQSVQQLFGRGVSIHSLANLHAKIYAFDRVAIIGSANLSRSSREQMQEAAIISVEQSLVQEATRHIAALAEMGRVVDSDFLQRILLIPVRRHQRRPGDEALSPPTPTSLHYLEVTPTDKALLRAYFVAFIRAQLGTVSADTRFHLWPKGNFRTHVKAQRLIKDGTVYMLTSTGVTEFTTGNGAPEPELLAGLVEALSGGNQDALPGKLRGTKLRPLPKMRERRPIG